MLNRSARVLPPVLLISISFATVLSAQVAPPPSGPSDPSQLATSQTPTLRTESRAVVVDVVVTKGDGQPVTALRKQDFTVTEDGKPVAVDYFEEHTSRKLPPGAIPPLEKMPPNVYTNVPPAPESDSVNVLLIDTLNTDMEDQSYVRQNILNFLKTMQPGVRVAVFVLGSSLRFVQGFTTDSSVLRDALIDKKTGVLPRADKSVTRSLQDKFMDIEDKQRLADMQMGAPGLEALADSQANYAGYQADQRVAMTLEALNYLGRYLAGVPGRKNLIWFSSSFPITVFPSTKEKQHLGEIREYSAALKKTADLLTVSKVAVYPVGAEGMMVNHGSDGVIQSNSAVDVEGGELNTRSGGAVPSQRPVGFMTPFTNENAARSDKIIAMEQLAADTGGKAFYNINDLNAAMMRAIDDGAHYYTLVYTPQNKKMDGKYRRIEVRIPESKYKLSYRRGYNADDTTADNAKDSGKSATDPLRPLLTYGLPSATQILFGARVAPISPQPPADVARAGKNAKLTGPTTRYAIDFLIRSTDVKLDLADDGSHTGKLQIGLLAYDRDGKAVNWAAATQGMELKPDVYASLEKSGVPAHMEIDLPNTDVYLDIGVYDWQTGKAGTMDILLRPDAPKPAQTAQK